MINKRLVYIGFLSILFLSLFSLSCDKREPSSSKIDYDISITLDQETCYAGLNDSIMVTAFLKESNNPVEEASIVFSSMPTDSSTETGYFHPIGIKTNSQGKAITYFFDNDIIADHSIEAIYDETITRDTVTVIPLSLNIGSLSLVINNQNPFIFPDDYDNTPQIITVNAIINDTSGVVIRGATVNFINNTPELGSLTGISSITNESGVAEINFIINSLVTGDASITAVVGDVTTTSAMVISQYTGEDYLEVKNLDTWVTSGEILIDNVNVIVSDTLSAMVTNALGGPVGDIPVVFNLISDIPGYLNQTLTYTDSISGYSESVFTLDPGALEGIQVENDIEVEVEVSILNSDEFIDTLSMIIHVSPNLFTPEYNAASLEFWSYSVTGETESLDINNDIISIDGDIIDIEVLVKDIYGVGVCNVPIRFELFDESDGVLNTALVYSLCVNSDEEGEPQRAGFADITYESGSTSTDTLRAYIIDPGNSSIVLFEDIITINNNTIPDPDITLDDIAFMNTWLNTGEILVDNINVAVSDTIFTQVTNESGGPVENVPIHFSLLGDHYGYLSNTIVYTDSSSGIAQSIFQLDPSSLPEGENDIQVDFEISVLESDEFIDTISVVIHLAENLFTPEYNVSEFHFYPNRGSYNHVIGEESELFVITKNQYGVGICNVPVYFELEQTRNSYGEINTALSYTTCESAADTSSESTQNGTTSVTYTNIEGTGSDVLRAYILDPENSSNVLFEDEITINNNTTLGYTLEDVSYMNTWLNTGEILVDNINVAVSDTIFTQVTNESGGPVENVPIHFSLLGDHYGYLSNTIVYTDSSSGIAQSIFQLDPSSLPEGENDIQVDFEISVLESDEFIDTISVVIHLAENLFTPEYNVSEFHFYPNRGSYNHVIGEESELFVITKNQYGVGICNVPVYFELEQTRNSYGEINTALSYTTCESAADTSSESTQNGTTSVTYTNIEGTGSDVLRAYILDPENSSNVLFEDEITINNNTTPGYTLEDVSYMNTWLSSTTISMVNTDSSFADTIYAVALDANGGSIIGIPFEFGLNDASLGQLTVSNVESDSTGIAKSIFTTVPGTTDTTVIFTVSIPEREDISESELTLTLIDNAPVCPDCEPSLSLTADPMVLPDSTTGATSTTITAFMVDSLGMAPEPNTVIEFEAMQENEEGEWVSVGSITPHSFFNDEGYAYAEFSMGNSAGLASIIGTSNGLVDTTHIVMNSTDASYIEIVQPIPNEIMVQGGGGVESTLIRAEIKDGNGNLVSDPYFVDFEITQPSPQGVHLNGLSGTTSLEVTSTNGVATVTLNAGTQPGSVRMRASLSTLDGEYISMAETIPVTIVTGPPAAGRINFSYVEISTIGGGNYSVPVSVSLSDQYSNPVSDSTNVYFRLLESADPYEEDNPYFIGDKVWWGQDTTGTDTLVYECIAEPTFNILPSNSDNWKIADPPATITGEAKTGMPSPSGESYQGLAWAMLIYDSSMMFEQIVVFVQTFDSDGNYLIVDSRDNHNNEATVLPYQPGVISVSSDLQFYDFNGDADGFTPDITITATISDYYNYPIDNGRLQLVATQAEILTVDGPDGGVNGELSIGLSNADGQVQWTIRYHESVCPIQTVDPTTYADFISTVTVQLLDPLQTGSDPIDITLINSTIE